MTHLLDAACLVCDLGQPLPCTPQSAAAMSPIDRPAHLLLLLLLLRNPLSPLLYELVQLSPTVPHAFDEPLLHFCCPVPPGSLSPCLAEAPLQSGLDPRVARIVDTHMTLSMASQGSRPLHAAARRLTCRSNSSSQTQDQPPDANMLHATAHGPTSGKEDTDSHIPTQRCLLVKGSSTVVEPVQESGLGWQGS